VAFIYNAFERAVVLDVVDTVVRSLSADPRPAWVIYRARARP
jgi:hypothetical protein